MKDKICPNCGKKLNKESKQCVIVNSKPLWFDKCECGWGFVADAVCVMSKDELEQTKDCKFKQETEKTIDFISPSLSMAGQA